MSVSHNRRSLALNLGSWRRGVSTIHFRVALSRHSGTPTSPWASFGMSRGRGGPRRSCEKAVQTNGLSLTTNSTNFHEWGAASPGKFVLGLIRSRFIDDQPRLAPARSRRPCPSLLRSRAVARSFSWVGMARRRRPTCVVKTKGLSLTTNSTNFHEWGAASPEILLVVLFAFIRLFVVQKTSASISEQDGIIRFPSRSGCLNFLRAPWLLLFFTARPGGVYSLSC